MTLMDVHPVWLRDLIGYGLLFGVPTIASSVGGYLFYSLFKGDKS